MHLAAVGLLLAVSVARPFAEERQLLDRRLEALRRILPDNPNAAADAALVTEMARSAGLQRLEVGARPPTESGGRGELGVEVRATGRYLDVDRFFRLVALSPRLVDVDSLRLFPSEPGLVAVEALLKVPFRSPRAPLPLPPEGHKELLSGVPRTQAEAFSRDQALAFSKTEMIAALRRSRRNPRLFLSEASAVLRDRPAGLTEALLGEEFVLRGLAAGEGTLRSLQSRLERGFLRVEQFLLTRRGGCFAFEARGHSPVVGPDAELPLPADDPFEAASDACRVDRDVAPLASIGSPPRKKGAPRPPAGDLTLRLRHVDAADVFRVLHELTGLAFVVDPDVVGRVSLDLSGVTLEQALAALEEAGLRIEPAGAVRRVSRASRPVGGDTLPGAEVPAGPLARFSLKRAEVRDLLATLAEIDPALASLGPPGPLGRVSVWVRDVPVGLVRAAVLESARLAERVEDGQRILSREGAAADPVPVAQAGPSRRFALGADEISVSEFALSGVALGPAARLAVAYSSLGELCTYRPGERLADGSVASVDSTDVVLETEEGGIRVPLEPLAR